MLNLLARLGDSLKAAAPIVARLPFAAQGGSGTISREVSTVFFADGLTQRMPGSAQGYNYDGLVGDPMQNSVVAACVLAYAKAFSQAPPILEHRVNGTWEAVHDHPALDLLLCPNDDLDLFDLNYASIAWKLTRGESPWVLFFNQAGTKPVEIWPWHPDKVKPIGTASDFISGYDVQGEDGNWRPLSSRQVIHFRYMPNLSNLRRGWTALSTGTRQMAGFTAAAEYHTAILLNAGVMSLLISIKQTAGADTPRVTPDQFQDMLARLRRKYIGNKASAGDIDGLNLPLEVTKMAYSPDEMSVDKLLSIFERHICALMDIDPAIAGFAGGSAAVPYSNLETIERAFWERSVIPLKNRDAATLTRQYLPLWFSESEVKDWRVAYDYSGVSALQDNQSALHSMWLADFAGGAIDLHTFQTKIKLPEVPDNYKGRFAVPTQPFAEDAPSGAIPGAPPTGEPDGALKYDARQPRDESGKWTVIAGERVSITGAAVSRDDIHEAIDHHVGTGYENNDVRQKLVEAHANGKIVTDDHLLRAIAHGLSKGGHLTHFAEGIEAHGVGGSHEGKWHKDALPTPAAPLSPEEKALATGARKDVPKSVLESLVAAHERNSNNLGQYVHPRVAEAGYATREAIPNRGGDAKYVLTEKGKAAAAALHKEALRQETGLPMSEYRPSKGAATFSIRGTTSIHGDHAIISDDAALVVKAPATSETDRQTNHDGGHLPSKYEHSVKPIAPIMFAKDKYGSREVVFDNGVTASAHHLDAVAALHPGATFYHNGKSDSALVAMKDGKVVAYVMPRKKRVGAQLKSLDFDDFDADGALKFDARQLRDDSGKWTDAATGGISAGHAVAVMKSEGLTDEVQHAEVVAKIEDGTHKTREDVLRHIDALHAGSKNDEQAMPVGNYLHFESQDVKHRLRPALEAIQKVHGILPVASIHVSGGGMNQGGIYSCKDATIGINTSDDASAMGAEMAFAHEVGHMIDHRVLAGSDASNSDAFPDSNIPVGMASNADYEDRSKTHPDMKRVLDAARAAPSFRRIAEQKGWSSYKEYLQSNHETFARAYAQWIATRSGDATMKAQIDALNRPAKGTKAKDFVPLQWNDEEFAPVAAAMDTLFANQGLLRQIPPAKAGGLSLTPSGLKQ